jgi:hypothetical protein
VLIVLVVRSDGKKMAVRGLIVVVWKETAANSVSVSGSVLGCARSSLGVKQSRNSNVVHWLRLAYRSDVCELDV